MNNYKKGSFRPNEMTQKDYAEYLGGISIRTIQNWESRGTSYTTRMLLMKIQEQEDLIEELYEIINDQNKTFILPK